jgi:hypothetical protein
MTPKNRKTLVICIGIIVALYITRSMITSGAQLAYYQRALQQASQQKAKPSPLPPVKPPEPVTPPAAPLPATTAPAPVAATAIPPVTPEPAPVVAPTIPPELTGLEGIWRGRTALKGRGICDLKFELADKEGDPGKLSGYSALTCNDAGALVSKGNGAREAFDRFSPEAAILTGTPDNGTIKFTLDKVVGTDANGYAPKSFALTPFGKGQLDAEWLEEKCSGGHIILRKTPR